MNRVVCPYCHQFVELWVDPETVGVFVEDCEVCCRPWAVFVERGHDPHDRQGATHVHVDRES